MDYNMTVNACIGVYDGCVMTYLINPDRQIEFSFGSSTRYPFELLFAVPALRHFVELRTRPWKRLRYPSLEVNTTRPTRLRASTRLKERHSREQSSAADGQRLDRRQEPQS
jgi:hypothetical protein